MAAQSGRQLRSEAATALPFLLSLVLAVGILYVAKPVLVPLSLAILLTFVLTPLVVIVQRWGLGRVPATLVVVFLTLVVCGLIGWGVGAQVTRLAEALPEHADEIKVKVQKLGSVGGGRFTRLLASFEKIGEASQKHPTTSPTSDQTPEARVVVAAQRSSALDNLITVASAVLPVVADAGLVLILVIFMLIRREDLRNRVIGLMGHGRLTGATRVLVDSASRISQLLLMQLAINAAFGLLFALILLAIGIPYWFLWGFLTAILRFVPFIGTWIAACLPVLLSIAIFPTWVQPLLVLGTFVGIDLFTSNVVEPLAFGHSAGVSPVALVIAAVFWTWIWGPIGLVLSTPLTVCLVVMGQHVPRLRFLSLLLGEEAPLPPHITLYQRLLAGDQHEAQEIVDRYLAEHDLPGLADHVLIPAARMARRDRLDAGLSAQAETAILDAIDKIIATVSARPASSTPPAGAVTPTILGHPAHHRAEASILSLLGAALADSSEMELTSTRTLPAELEARVASEHPKVVFIAVMPPGGTSQARYLCSRLHRVDPQLNIVVGYFGRARDFDRLLVRLRARGASYLTTSVEQSLNQLRALGAAMPPTPVSEPERATPVSSVATT